MKIDDITKDPFSYKEPNFNKFTTRNYVLAALDEDRPQNNIIPVLYNNNGAISSIDPYDMEKIVVVPHKNIKDRSLSKYSLQQFVKITQWGIDINERYHEGSPLPKCKVVDSSIYPVQDNEIIEIFTGDLLEEETLFKPEGLFYNLFVDTYLESNNEFFIIDKNELLIGPFQAIKVSGDSFKVNKGNTFPFGEYYHNEDTYIELIVNDLKRKIFIKNCKDPQLVLSRKSDYSFISNDELIQGFLRDIETHSYNFKEDSLLLLKKILNYNNKTSNRESIDIKNSRIRKILELKENAIESNINLLEIVPNVKKLKEDEKRLNEKLFDLDNQINESKRQINILNERKRLLEKEIEEEKQIDKISKEIEELKQRRENLEAEVTSERKELEKHLDELKKEIEDLKVIETHYTKLVNTLKEEFTSEQKDAQYKLAELVKGKTHFDFISGRDLSIQTESKIKLEDYTIENQFHTYQDFRNKFSEILSSNNRKFDKHFIDNLLISIYQNTFTILAGAPGTGKTSLARLITNLLTPEEKIREISVSRGWTSSKDLIGFHNPLTKKFNAASTNVYSLLKQLNLESNNEHIYRKTPLSFIILDEANLSPIEHYWSSFYNLTDSQGIHTLNLSSHEIVKYPNNLRFIGTINYDFTTEELSPRVIDRVNIIKLNKGKELRINGINNDIMDIDKIDITFDQFSVFFKLNSDELSNEIRDNLDIVRREFNNLKIFISPRVDLAIQKYLNVACRYMTDINKPLDYCIAQRLLPQINLYGNEYKQKLEGLLQVLETIKCEISVDIVREILDIGNTQGVYEGNYNYFLTISNV